VFPLASENYNHFLVNPIGSDVLFQSTAVM
jgi:hypothetical protein